MNMEYTHFKKVTEAEEKGLVCTMNRIVERERTDLNNELSDYFRDNMEGYNGEWDVHHNPNELDYVLGGINEYIEEYHSDKFEYEIDFPDESGDLLYLIPITENLELKIIIADEYYGDGDYNKYIDVTKFVISEKATFKDVDKLIEFVKEYLTIKGDK